ncbi:MAG: oligopeptide/dipeptide ABC transporter ATP-binding protein, partial [Candidatus Hodarchaeota archaeon]
IIGIMYAGNLVEKGDAIQVFNESLHPYTKALCAAFPNIKGEKREIPNLEGLPPSLMHPPSGCRFHPRCYRAEKICSEKVPEYKDYGNGHMAACFFAGE